VVHEPPLLPGSVDAYVATAVPVCEPGESASDVRDRLVGGGFESVTDVAVCRTDPATGMRRLAGLMPVERLLAAAPDTVVGDLMDTDPPVIAPGTDQEQAAWKAARHGESSLAVVGEDGHFRGLVPPARLLSVLLEEHDEDLARLGGFLSSTASARHALEEPVRARVWHRLPWLLLGLVGSGAAAWLVRGYEADLSSDVRLAFFMPGIVYMADAVGTQTEALVIRGLSVGVPIRRVFRRESVTGLMVGILLAACSWPAIWLSLGSASLAATVSLALLAACAVATLVAMSLPWLMTRLGRDPAFGSGPLATVVQDLLSLVLYFAIASWLM
jgi:magnesium transporter